MHSAKCLRQECDKSDQLCGSAKFGELFDPISAKLGDKLVEVFQHIKLSYTKADGSKVMLISNKGTCDQELYDHSLLPHDPPLLLHHPLPHHKLPHNLCHLHVVPLHLLHEHHLLLQLLLCHYCLVKQASN